MQASRSVPTLDDVARTAGVSTATVSRCLNSPDRVVEKTRKRVMDAVEALGYTPNFGARVMAAKRTFTIGAIIPTIENAIFARGLQAFQEELHTHGYTLLVASSGYDAQREAEQIRALVARGADGLLLIGHARDEALYDYLDRQKVPVLIAWTHTRGARNPSVGFDNRAAMTALAHEIFALGHRRVGMISAPTLGNDRTTQRVEGIKDAARRHGIDPQTLPILITPYEVESGASALDSLLDAHPDLTAILCSNDVQAVGAMKRARERGLSIPRDISITGFDDMDLAQIVVPALTSVAVPHRDMGRQAATALVDMVENKTPGPTIELATDVKLRGSIGPYPPGD